MNKKLITNVLPIKLFQYNLGKSSSSSETPLNVIKNQETSCQDHPRLSTLFAQKYCTYNNFCCLLCSTFGSTYCGNPSRFPGEAGIAKLPLIQVFLKINYDLLLSLYLALLPSYVCFTNLINRKQCSCYQDMFTVRTAVKLMSGSSVKR